MKGRKCPKCGYNTMFQLRHIRKCSECGLELVLVFQHGKFVPMPIEVFKAAHEPDTSSWEENRYYLKNRG